MAGIADCNLFSLDFKVFSYCSVFYTVFKSLMLDCSLRKHWLIVEKQTRVDLNPDIINSGLIIAVFYNLRFRKLSVW